MKKTQINKFYLLTFLFLFCPMISSFADNIPVYQEQRLLLKYKLLESEWAPGHYIHYESIKSSAKDYTGKKIPLTRPSHNRMVTLYSEFFLPENLKGKEIALILLPAEYTYQVFINQKSIHKVGNIENPYSNRIHHSELILLTSDYLNFNNNNVITIQLYPKEGEDYPFQQLFITSRADGESYVFWRNFFSIRFVQAMALCSLFIFFYYFILYLIRKNNKPLHYLYFSLVNLTFTLMYSNNFINYELVNTFIIEKISRTSVIFLSGFGILFFVEYFGLWTQKRKLYHTLVLVLFFPAALFLLIQPNTYSILKANNIYPLKLAFLTLLLYLFLVIAAIRKKKSSKKLYLLLGMVLCHFIFATHDIYYFGILMVKPFVLLVPYSLFLINLILFFLLALEQNDIYMDSIGKSMELKKLNENLEKIITERTLQLTVANDTKLKFFSIIAHDLKGPIGSLTNALEILSLSKNLSPEDMQETHQYLNHSAKQTFSLLEHLLTWSLAQKDEIYLNIEKLNLYNEITTCLEPLEILANEKKIILNKQIDQSLWISADRNTFLLILRNLLSNAIKFSHPNKSIDIYAHINHDSQITISIKDYGIGISKEILQNITSMNKKFTTPGTKGERGTGFGLILCYELIQKNKGRLEIFSTPGQGSKFILYFPKAS